MADTEERKRAPKRRLPFQEAGLLIVILCVAGGLSLYGFLNPTATKRRTGVDANGAPIFETFVQNKFLNPDTLLTLAKETSFFAIMALGATFIIITAGIDISVGSVYALSAVAGGAVLHLCGPKGAWAGTPGEIGVLLGVLTCLAVGSLCGLANGVMITALRVHPFVITLGTMAIYRGIAFVTTKGQAIIDFPPAMQQIMRWDMGQGLYPVPLLIMIVAVTLAGIFLKRTVVGQEIYAVGGNVEAARFSGLRVNRLLILVYTLAGMAAGLASVILLGYYGSATSDTGNGYELTVIASAVVGGAALTGGRGTALGCFLGALLIKMIDQGIVIMDWNQQYSRIITGSVIIIAVVLDRINQAITQKRLSAQT